jgi:S-DNA-T family DNA segregation ATPase FtsK/SpoIIIE
MAKASRKRKTTVNEVVANENNNALGSNVASVMSKKDKIRLSLGLVAFIVGSFLTLSIIGYTISWKKDQDLLVSSKSIWNFLFENHNPVANFCGRLGAALAHGLVYNGIGISVILVTIWLTGIGYNLLTKKKVFPATKWLNVIALGFLFLSPLLAYIFRTASFSYGGAFGNTLIEWTSGFAGDMGIILMTILMFAFFYLLVFQFKVQPILNVIATIFPERNSKVQHQQLTDEQFKGFTNPEVSMDEQEQLIKKAENEGCNYVDNDIQDDEADVRNRDLEVESEYKGLNFSYLPKDEDDTQELPEELMPTLHIKKEESFILDEHSTRESKSKTKNNDPDFLVVTPNDEVVEHCNDIKVDGINEPEVIVVNAIVDNGIVLEIPEVAATDIETTDELILNEVLEEPLAILEDELDIINDDDKEDNDDDKEDDVDDKEDDVEFNINEAIAEKKAQLNGAHFGIDTPYDPELELADYKFPTLDLLQEVDQDKVSIDRQELENNKNQIVNTLRSFGIEIQRISATVGPTVTLYEIVPAEGVRISKIKNLEDDIALNLAALGIRIIAPIPGRGTIGIEVPNTKKQIVSMRSILASEKFQNTTMSLPIALGKKIDNENYIVDLATMPHLLMAGATGQGKSVGINAILVSLLYKKHPSELKFVMVDPKKVELSIYRLIEKHYLAMLPDEEEAIITDTKKVVNTLNALCIEMDNRYELLKDAGARNIKEYNEKFKNRKLNPQNGHKYLPFIVLVIDEFADLIMTAGKEVEMPIARLAQLARAIGIHIIIATQRPSVNVITGIIKANFPARIAFRVSAKVDSRTILDASGADQLIGRGDMLISIGSDLLRLQCAFVDTPEVERIVEFIGAQRGYPTAFQLPEYEGAETESITKDDIDLSKRDKMFEEAARLVVSSQSGSTSMLQRKFNLGYNRAGRIMDQLEAAGIVGPTQGSKPREVLIHTEYELENLLEELF